MKSKKIANFWNHIGSNGNSSSHQGSSSSHDDIVVFGVPLVDIIKRNGGHGPPGSTIPSVVSHIATNIREEALRVEGIFRIPGSNMDLQQLKKQYNQGKIATRDQLQDRCDDIHTQASLLKLYIRELPDPLFTFALYEEFVRSHSQTVDKYSRVGSLKSLLTKLPPAHFNLLRFLAGLLKEISQHSHYNKMTSTNLAIIFGPTVMRPKNEDVVKMIEDARHVNAVFLMVIDEYDYLFGGAESPLFLNNSTNSSIGKGSSPLISNSSNSLISSPIRILQQQNHHYHHNGSPGSKKSYGKLSLDESSPNSPTRIYDDLLLNNIVLRSPNTPPVPPPSPSSSPGVFQPPTITTQTINSNNINSNNINNNNNNSNNTPTKLNPKFSILLPTASTKDSPSKELLSPHRISNSNNSPLLLALPPASPRSSLILQDDNSELIRNLIHKTCSVLFDKEFIVNDSFEIPQDEYFIPVIEQISVQAQQTPSSPNASPNTSFINTQNISNDNTLNTSSSSPNTSSLKVLSPRKPRVLGIPTSNGESTSSPSLRSLFKSHVNSSYSNLNISNNNANTSTLSPPPIQPLSISSPPLSSLSVSNNNRHSPVVQVEKTNIVIPVVRSPLDQANDNLSRIRKEYNRPLDPNQMSPKELHEEKSAIKQQLRNFDQNFKEEKGYLPKKSDREIMRPLYQRYREIKALMETINYTSSSSGSGTSGSYGRIGTYSSTSSGGSSSQHNQSHHHNYHNSHSRIPLKNVNFNNSIPTLDPSIPVKQPTVSSPNINSSNSTSIPIQQPQQQPQQQQQLQDLKTSNASINSSISSIGSKIVTSPPQQSIQSPNLTLSSSNGNLSTMTRQELKERYIKVKNEKRNVQVDLLKYQTEFMKKHGRKVQFTEDRIPVQSEYGKYKELKLEMTNIEKLLNITPPLTSSNF